MEMVQSQQGQQQYMPACPAEKEALVSSFIDCVHAFKRGQRAF